MIIKDLKIKMADCKADNIFEDNVMKVQYVPLVREDIEDEEPLDKIIETEKEIQVGTNGIPVSECLTLMNLK